MAKFRAKAFFNKIPKKGRIAIYCALALSASLVIIVAAKKIVSSATKTDTTVYTVKKEIYENVIEIAGTVSAAKSQTLQSLNDGTVVGVYKKEGDSVKKGDLIVEVDLEGVKNAGYDVITPMIVSNHSKFSGFEKKSGKVAVGDAAIVLSK